MKIGFDGKRYFHNETGLGNYSRNIVNALCQNFPEHQYVLFNPKKTSKKNQAPCSVVTPHGIWEKFPSLWRSLRPGKEAAKMKLDIYHGLSHDMPLQTDKRMQKIVTIHDLIFLRYPQHYATLERKIHTMKTRHSCKISDHIVAISKQTKRDLMEFYGVEEKKIKIIHQACNPSFGIKKNDTELKSIQKKHRLPRDFFLYVGRIEHRKNLELIVRTLPKDKADLVVVGNATGYAKGYFQKIKSIIQQRNMDGSVHFLRQVPMDDLCGIYQMAQALLYPSFFEGFGLPVLEALWSEIPVISSFASCLTEVGGRAPIYIDPNSADDLQKAMEQVLTMSLKDRNERVSKGLRHVEKFKSKKITQDLMNLYENGS